MRIDRLAVSRLVGLLPHLYHPDEIQMAKDRLTKNGRWKKMDLRRLLDERHSIRDKDQRLFQALVKALGGMKGLASRLHRLENRERLDYTMAVNLAVHHPRPRWFPRPYDWIPRIGPMK